MAISMSDHLRTHTFVEMCKTEALSSGLKLLECVGQSMTATHEEFIISSVLNYIDQYSLEDTYDLESYILIQPDQTSDKSVEQAEDFFVKASEVSTLFSKLQGRVVGMLVGLVINELTLFLLMEGRDSDG